MTGVDVWEAMNRVLDRVQAVADSVTILRRDIDARAAEAAADRRRIDELFGCYESQGNTVLNHGRDQAEIRGQIADILSRMETVEEFGGAIEAQAGRLSGIVDECARMQDGANKGVLDVVQTVRDETDARINAAMNAIGKIESCAPLRTKVDDLADQLGTVRAEVAATESQIAAVREAFAADIGSARGDIGAMRADMIALCNDIGTIDSRMADIGTMRNDLVDLRAQTPRSFIIDHAGTLIAVTGSGDTVPIGPIRQDPPAKPEESVEPDLKNRAIKMRAKKLSYRQIAEKLGIGTSKAWRLVNR
jgi:hypothetical protein